MVPVISHFKQAGVPACLRLKRSVTNISHRVAVTWLNVGVSSLAIFVDLCEEIGTFLIWGRKRAGL